VFDSSLSLFRRALGDERGMALPYALGVTMVLSALAAAIFTYTTTNQGAAKRAQADQKAYGLAETGLSYALSRLQNAADPTNAGNVPSTTVALTGGSTTYSGSLSGTTWTLTSAGTVANPSGPHAANVTRTVSMQAAITTTTQADMRPWDYLFVDQPAGCITLGNSVTLTISLYVRGNLCLENNSQASGPAVDITGNLYTNSPQASVGTSGDPIDEFSASGACHYTGAPLPCGPSTRVWAGSVGTSPPTISKPTADLAYWYTNAQLGPNSSCSTGSFPGGFDDDTTLNVSRGEIDLTPASAYDCRKVDGSGNVVAQLAWQPGSPGLLTIKGVIYFDGHLTWSNLNLITYVGKAVIYGSGQVRIKNRADICGVATCDGTWNPQQNLIVFVAGSLIAESSTTTVGGDIGNHVNFQGALYIVNDFDMDNNTTFWGPVITRSTTINNSALINAPPLPIEWMYGMPGATTTVTEIDPVQGSYAG
jgi:Tfp pilus assembly protein PilX